MCYLTDSAVLAVVLPLDCCRRGRRRGGGFMAFLDLAPEQLVAMVVEGVLRVTGQVRELLDPQLDGAVPDLSLPGVVKRGLDPPQQPLHITGNCRPPAGRRAGT